MTTPLQRDNQQKYKATLHKMVELQRRELSVAEAALARIQAELLQAMRNESEQVLGELAAQSELNGRIWASMKAFQAQAEAMHAISEKELYDWR